MKYLFRFSKSIFNRSFAQIALAGLFLIFFIYFIRNEHLDIIHLKSTLVKANPTWVIVGIGITILYLLLQAYLYVYSFKSIGVSIGIRSALKLFLKRNFVSTFLPAGTFTSLAFFDDELDQYKLEKVQVHYGSFLFALASMISIVMIAVPTIAILLLHHNLMSMEIYGLVFLLCLIGSAVYLAYSLAKRRGFIFKLLNQTSPQFVAQISDLSSQHFRLPIFIRTCLISFVIELAGVLHLYIALAALGMQPSVEVSMLGYVIMILILSISPFLRGLGAIEVSVTYVLTLYGYPTLLAASVTLLFRFFEFWLPFFISTGIFLIRKGNLMLRVYPVFFILILGVVNIISALTPAIPERLLFLTDFIPFSVTEFSNIAVLLLGIAMIITSAFLLTGANNAWRLALAICIFSFIGHLTKALDYEEALVALITILILWYTRQSYFVKHNITFQLKAVQKIMILVVALFFYSIAGFYLLQIQHLGFDFNLTESFQSSIKSMLFMTDDLIVQTKAGQYFLYSIQLGSTFILAFSGFLLYSATKTNIHDPEQNYSEGLSILEHCGQSSMDYFKVYPDKQLFFNEAKTSFISFAEAKNYAVVLENPVASDQAAVFQLLQNFETYCNERGLRTFYYRVREEDLSLYQSLNKKNILLGQEAILDLTTFSMEGSQKKALRNAVNKIEHGDYHFSIYQTPLKDGLLQQLKSVSDEWLRHDGHSEIGFSQGIFNTAEVKKTTVLTVENKENRILAFLNLVPSYRAGEATYDLIRQTDDAPNGAIDYLMIKMIDYFKGNNFKTLNLGMAPMAGIQGVNMNEQLLQFYRDHFKIAARFKGLFEYKNKFEPRWENRYLIYDQLFDLIRFPSVLKTVQEIDK